MEYKVTTEKQLLVFLLEEVPKLTRTKAKSLLKYGQIFVNGKPVKAFDFMLHPGVVVSIGAGTKAVAEVANRLDILFENEELIVIDKPEGLLSVPAEDASADTAYARVEQYLSLKKKKDRAYVVHRLDQDTSGVLLFAKSQELKQALQNNWNALVSARIYFAVVEGLLERKQDVISSYLRSDEHFYVRSSQEERKDSKLAVTEYKVLRETEEFSLLEVSIKTGRKNQIRVHMSGLGHPVIGDKKYGSKVNPLRRLGLHAAQLTLTHPLTGATLSFQSKMPKPFLRPFRT